MSSRETAEKPRTVASMPGMPTMRELFGKKQRDFVVAVAARADSSLRRKAEAFRTNSALWRAEGLATRTSASGSAVGDVTALAAQTVDLPHWRVQLRMTRSASHWRTRDWWASGVKPSAFFGEYVRVEWLWRGRRWSCGGLGMGELQKRKAEGLAGFGEGIEGVADDGLKDVERALAESVRGAVRDFGRYRVPYGPRRPRDVHRALHTCTQFTAGW